MKNLVRRTQFGVLLFYYTWLVVGAFMLTVPMSQQMLASGRPGVGLAYLVTGVLIAIEMTKRAEDLVKQKIFEMLGGKTL